MQTAWTWVDCSVCISIFPMPSIILLNTMQLDADESLLLILKIRGIGMEAHLIPKKVLFNANFVDAVKSSRNPAAGNIIRLQTAWSRKRACQYGYPIREYSSTECDAFNVNRGVESSGWGDSFRHDTNFQVFRVFNFNPKVDNFFDCWLGFSFRVPLKVLTTACAFVPWNANALIDRTLLRSVAMPLKAAKREAAARNVLGANELVCPDVRYMP